MEKDEFNQLFGEFIAEKRKSRNWKQSDLSDKLGNNFQNVSRLERGEINPSIHWTTVLAKVFEIPLSELMREFEDFVSKKQKEPSSSTSKSV